MRRRLQATAWLGIVCALCAAVVWWLSRPVPPVAPEPSPPVRATQNPAADAVPVEPAVRVEAPRPPAATAPPEDPLAAGPAGEPSAGRATVTGRCLAAEDRRPIAEVVVELVGAGEVARSAADGTFRAEVVPDSRGAVTLRLAAAGRAARIGSFAGMKHGSHEDLGDLLLPRGWQVRGLVTEVDGTGVGGNNVLVFGVDTALREGQSKQGVAGGACAEDGAFVLDQLLPSGSYRALVFGARRKQRGDGAFVVDPVRGVEPLHLVLEPLELVPSIRGTVVDARGLPVAGVGLRAEAGGVPAQSDPLGRFVLLADGPVTGATRVLLQQPERWAATFSPPAVEWGQDDVRIELPDGPRLTIEVVDDAGAAVPDYSVLLGPADQQFLPENRACGRRHEGGRCGVATPARGELMLRVVPTGDDLDCSELRRIELGSDGSRHERFVLSRLAAAAVIVVDEAGGPVSGAEVCLLRLGKDLEQARHHDRDPRALRLHTLVDGVSERVSGGKTAADGRASLRSPRLAQGLGLRVRAEGFVTELIVDPGLSPTSPLRVVLRRGGALRVEVDRNGEPRELFAVVLWDATGQPVHRIDGRLDAEGVCVVPVLSAGRYAVSVHRQLVLELPGQSVMRHAACGAPVVDVEVVGGGTANVRIDVPHPSFGVLDGRLVGAGFPGEVPQLLVVALVRLDAVDLRLGFFPVAADGSFRAEGLLPGRYRIAVQDSALGELQSVKGQLDAVVEIEPGSTRSAEFAYVRRRLHLRLRWPDGQPVTAPVEYRCGTLTAAARVAGELVLDPAPELPIEVRAGDSGEWSAPVSMPRDRTEAVVEVTVPEPR